MLGRTLTFNKQELQKWFISLPMSTPSTWCLRQMLTGIGGSRASARSAASVILKSTDVLRNLSSVSHNLCSSPAEFSSFTQPLLRAGSAADSEDVYTLKAPSNILCMEFGDLLVESAVAPPPQHHKTPLWGSPQHRPPVSDYKYPTRGEEAACWSVKSLEKTVMGQSDTASSDDNYVPTNSVSDILMSTMPHHFDKRGSKIQPPPGQYSPQAWLKSKASINELPFKTPVTKSLSTVNHTFNSSSSQYCCSISNTDSRNSEENYIPMQNPMSSSPVSSGINSSAPKKRTGNVNYIALDFQPVSQSPHQKPSTSSVTSDEKGEYVQVDKKKKTIQEWTKMLQSSRPSQDAKLWPQRRPLAVTGASPGSALPQRPFRKASSSPPPGPKQDGGATRHGAGSRFSSATETPVARRGRGRFPRLTGGDGRRGLPTTRQDHQASSTLSHEMSGLNWKPFVYGGLASIVAEFGTFPVDLTKTRLQVQGQSIDVRFKEIKYRGMFHALFRIYKEEGILALYSG
ncbi:hypothetical protein NN561_006795 [Cricetulus griseus]